MKNADFSLQYSWKKEVPLKSIEKCSVSFQQYRKPFLHKICVNGSNNLEAIEQINDDLFMKNKIFMK